MPAKNFEIDSNPQKVGREPIGVKNGAFTSEQRRRSGTFCKKGGTVERATDFLLQKNRNEQKPVPIWETFTKNIPAIDASAKP